MTIKALNSKTCFRLAIKPILENWILINPYFNTCLKQQRSKNIKEEE